MMSDRVDCPLCGNEISIQLENDNAYDGERRVAEQSCKHCNTTVEVFADIDVFVTMTATINSYELPTRDEYKGDLEEYEAALSVQEEAGRQEAMRRLGAEQLRFA